MPLQMTLADKEDIPGLADILLETTLESEWVRIQFGAIDSAAWYRCLKGELVDALVHADPPSSIMKMITLTLKTSAVRGGENVHHSRVQRILATRHAPVHERMAIMRQLASEFDQQRQAEPSSTTAAAETKNRYSLATRIFGRTRRSSNAPEVSSAVAPATMAPTAGKASTSPTAPATNTATEEASPRP